MVDMSEPAMPQICCCGECTTTGSGFGIDSMDVDAVFKVSGKDAGGVVVLIYRTYLV